MVVPLLIRVPLVPLRLLQIGDRNSIIRWSEAAVGPPLECGVPSELPVYNRPLEGVRIAAST